MSTHRTAILEQINGVFNGINPDELISTPTFVTILAIRNGLVEAGFSKVDASEVVSKIKIELPMDLFDDEDDKRLIYEIIDNIVKMIAGLYKSIMPEIGSFNLFVNMIEGTNLEITDG